MDPVFVQKRNRSSVRGEKKILHSRTPRSAKLPCIQSWLPEVVGNVRFLRIQTIRVVNLLIVDVADFNIGKN